MADDHAELEVRLESGELEFIALICYRAICYWYFYLSLTIEERHFRNNNSELRAREIYVYSLEHAYAISEQLRRSCFLI